MKTVILQPGYLPWAGAFAQMAWADTWVFLDDVTFQRAGNGRAGWDNRNRVRSPKKEGFEWLTVPIVKADHRQDLNEAMIVTGWSGVEHLERLEQLYRGAPHLDDVLHLLLAGPLIVRGPRLARLNELLIRNIADYLGLQPTFHRSSKLGIEGRATERLVSICRALGATEYMTGPASAAYLEADLFAEAGIELHYSDFAATHGAFEPFLSIVDWLMYYGRDTVQLVR